MADCILCRSYEGRCRHGDDRRRNQRALRRSVRRRQPPRVALQVFKSPNVKLATKVTIFLAMVQSRLLYAAETLVVTAAHLQQLERCRMTFILVICSRLPKRRDPDNPCARAGDVETLALWGLEPVGAAPAAAAPDQPRQDRALGARAPHAVGALRPDHRPAVGRRRRCSR